MWSFMTYINNSNNIRIYIRSFQYVVETNVNKYFSLNFKFLTWLVSNFQQSLIQEKFWIELVFIYWNDKKNWLNLSRHEKSNFIYFFSFYKLYCIV